MHVASRRDGSGLALRDLDTAGGDAVVLAADVHLVRERSRYERFAKPVIDRIGALFLLAMLAPVLLAAAAAVAVSLGRPILYRQTRIGQHGQPFEMVKFRTMLPDRRTSRGGFHGPDRRRHHKTDRDPRHTPVGRFLRAFSLDELPQLWHVLTGELSLVGPRPELAVVVEERYQPWQHARHAVKPGITGLWQVTDRASNPLMYECVETDLRYVRSVRLRTDLWILLMTVPTILGLRARGL